MSDGGSARPRPKTGWRRWAGLGFTWVGGGVLALALWGCALDQRNSRGPLARPPASAPGALRMASFNVHYIILNKASGAWSVGDWEVRKAPMDAAVKAVGADVIAFQEMESFAHGDDGSTNLTRDYLLAQNPGYRAAAVGDWRSFPSTQPIFYRTDRLRVLDQGWFFFSTTPEVIYSRTFDGSYPAFASWAKLSPKAGGKPFYVFNMHFEYKSSRNRKLSAALVQERMAPLIAQGATVFLAGDLNARLGSDIVQGFEAAGLEFVPIAGSTYHFNRGLNLFGAIDHLAATPDAVQVGEPGVVRQKFGSTWPSDHYLIFADYRLPK